MQAGSTLQPSRQEKRRKSGARRVLASIGFNRLNWHPDGAVRGIYSVKTKAPSSASPGGNFVVTGLADIDGDKVILTYTATKSLGITRVTAKDIF